MENIPKLSIIIPNYNNCHFLEDCLVSILKQTYKNYEIIICDDCSTDDSVNLIEQYTKKYNFIRTIYHQKNIGIALNRNSGIQIARGLYLTVLDADDIYYDIYKLEKEMEIVQYYKEKENRIVCAFSKIAILDKGLKYLGDQWSENMIREGNIFNEIICRSAMIPRDYIVATEVYNKVHLYDKLCQPYEDWDLKIRLAKNYNFYFSGIYGTGYRKHGDGLSNITFAKRLKILKKVFNKNFGLVNKSDKVKVKKTFNLFIQNKRLQHINSLKEIISTLNFWGKIIQLNLYFVKLYHKIIFICKIKN